MLRADVLFLENDEWLEGDFIVGPDGAPQVSKEAAARVKNEKSQWLLERIADGSLPSRGRGRRLRIQSGDFDDLTGCESGACPEDCLLYRIVPDTEGKAVETDRFFLQRLQDVLGDGPFARAGDRAEPPGESESMNDRLRRAVAFEMISTWIRMRVTEQILDEIGGEFDGNDPLKPAGRKTLNEVREKLLSYQQLLEDMRMSVVLREPLSEEIDDLREFVAQRVA